MFEFLFNFSLQTWQKSTFFFASEWANWMLAVCIVAAGVISFLSLYRQRQNLSQSRLGVLWILQTLVATLLLLMLWQPSLEVEEIAESENRLVILLDTSASMHNVESENSRLQSAVNALQEGPLENLKSTFNTRLFTVSDDLLPLNSLQDLPDPGRQSNLGESLQKSLDLAASEPLAAVVLISDGSDNGTVASQPDWWKTLRQYGVPIHSVGIGRISLPEDLELLDVQMASNQPAGQPGKGAADITPW